MSEVRQFTVAEEDDGIRLDRWFKRHLPDLGFGVVARWTRTGQVRVDGRRAAPGDRVEAGQTIRVPPAEPSPDRPQPAARRPITPEEAEFARSLVIHKDDHALVLNKPPGLATQGGTRTTTHVDGLLDALSFERDSRPKLVHRLDRDTSGVLLVARSAAAAGFFSKAFSGRTARKIYWALVVGVPKADSGVIDAPLAKQPGTGGEKMHVDAERGLAARTAWRVIERAGNRAAWVEFRPLTGRTHQIRAHAAALGHPIVGDAKYGGRDAFLTGGISRKLHLHARRLVIDHPDGGVLDVTAPLPSHFAESMATLGFEEAAGDALALAPPEAADPDREQRRLAAQARDRRRARRGERRRRARA